MQSSESIIDERLLERARSGDRQAHEVLYRTFAPMVFTLAYRMLGSRASAEDVLQDSFVEVIRKAGDFRGDAGIRSWIKRIAVNKCLSHLRSPWVVRRRVVPDNAQACDTNARNEFKSSTPVFQADETAQRIGRQQELERALSALSATARAVVWLHDVEGYTHKEIGRLMNRSPSFSKSQLARAYTELRELLYPESTDEEAEPCLGILKTV